MSSIDLARIVNGFHGTASFPLPLVQLPGPEGLSVELTAFYDSSAAIEQQPRSNLRAPTSVLGLGWALQLDAIVALRGNETGPDAVRYVMMIAGAAVPLVSMGSDATGLRFAPVDGRPWTLHYAGCWTVVRDDGVTLVFGDPDSAHPVGATQDGVAWGSWFGVSAQVTGQGSVGLVWSLARLTDPAGRSVNYAYDTVTAPVAPAGGYPTAVASYLRQIVDAVGRTITLTYADKDPSEYVVPHATGAVDPYQDRYETRYLASIDITSASGAALEHIALATRLDTTAPAKRYLVGITSTVDGVVLPGLAFGYGGAGVPAGALASVTLASGGTATLSYRQLSLPLTDRAQAITVPDGFSQPRFWQGPGFVVVTWTDSHQLAGQVWRWVGRWDAQPLTAQPCDRYANTEVVFASDGFVVVTDIDGATWPATAYHTDPAVAGQWVAHGDSIASGSAVAAGRSVVAFAHPTAGPGPIWWWDGAAWQVRAAVATTVDACALAVDGDAVVLATHVAGADEVALTVTRLDAGGAWSSTPIGTIATSFTAVKSMALSVTLPLVALCVVDDGYLVDTPYYWAIAWQSGRLVSESLNVLGGVVYDTSPQAMTCTGAMISIANAVARYDGAAFVTHQFALPLSGKVMAITPQCGGDVVVRRVTTQDFSPGIASHWFYDMVAWDPLAGFTSPLAPLPNQAQAYTQVAEASRRTPTDYVLYADQLYYRTPSGSWTSIFTIPGSALVALSQPQMVGEALCYPDGSDAVCQLFRDGVAGASLRFPDAAFASYRGNKSGAVGLGVVAVIDSSGAASLHAIVDEALSGSLSPWVVATITVNDGWDDRVIGFGYDADTAITASGGRIACFRQSTVWLGGADATTASGGGVVTMYQNSVVDDGPPPPTWALGTITATSLLDTGGNPVGGSTLSWAASVTRPNPAAVAIRTQVQATTTTRDGVTTRATLTYRPETGQLATTTTTIANPSGALETQVAARTYAWQEYPALQRANLLSALAGQSVTVDGALASASATTWLESPWGPVPQAQWYWNQTGAGTFDYGGTNPDWVQSLTRTATGPNGVATGQASLGGPSTTIVSTDGDLMIATIDDVPPNAVAYFGGEAYEAGGGWGWCDGSPLASHCVVGNAHTGVAAMALPPNTPAGPWTNLVIPAGAGPVVMCAWICTDAQFGSDVNTAGFNLVVDGHPLVVPTFTDTQGQWQFWSFVVATSDAWASTFDVVGYSQKLTSTVLIDDLLIVPVGAEVEIAVYDRDRRRPTALIDQRGLVTRLAYAANGDTAVMAGPTPDAVQSWAWVDLERPFTATAPTARTALSPRGPGWFDEFWSDRWTTRWSPQPVGAWQRSGGQLTTAVGGALTTAGPIAASDVAVRVAVAAAAGPISFGLELGPVRVSWTTSLQVIVDGVAVASIARPTTPRVLAVAAVAGRLLVWVDDRLVFDQVTAVPPALPATVQAGAGVALTSLSIITSPTIAITHTDALGLARQAHAIVDATAVATTQQLRDALGRAAIETIPTQLGASADGTLVSYRADFVTNGGLGQSVWTGAAITGSVLTGALDGYPFTRTVFEDNPLGRAVASGGPGQPWSIGGHASTVARYANSATTPVPWPLPLGQYFVEHTTDPDGNEFVVVRDVGGRTVGATTEMTRQVPSPADPFGTWNGTSTYGYRSAIAGFGATEITACAWVRTSSTNSEAPLVCYAESDVTTGFRIENPTALTVWVGGASLTTQASIADGAWHHVAATFVAATSFCTLLVDGVVVAGANIYADGFPPPNQDFYVGARPVGDWVYFDGVVTEVQLWRRALDAAEIAATMHRRSNGGGVGLVLAWPLDEGSGTTAFDRGPNGNTGALVELTWTGARVPTPRALTSYGYDRAGRMIAIHPPAYYDPPAGSTADSFVTRCEYDVVGQLVSRTTPDGGTQQCVYDAAGRLRFAQTAAAAADGQFLYYCYDWFGRQIEAGVVTAVWDRATLTAQATAAPSYPIGVGQAAMRWTYATSSDPTAYARPVTVTTYAGQGFTESFAWDLRGRMITRSPEGMGGKQLAWTYDNAGNVTSIQEGSAAPSATTVTYGYDRTGRLATIGSISDPTAYARYTYRATGQLATESIGPSIQRTFQYDAHGALAGIDCAPWWTEQLSRSGGLDDLTYWNGRLAAVSITTHSGPPLSPGAWRNRYDTTGQLLESVAATGDHLVASYDPNGNLTSLGPPGAPMPYLYAGGNRTTSVDGRAIGYDPDGNLTSIAGPITGLTYDRFAQRLTQAGIASGQVTFSYDANGRHVVRTSPQLPQRSYLRGLHGRTFLEYADDGSPGGTTTQYIHGPTGLIAFIDGTGTKWVTTDHLGSARVVIDGSGNVVQQLAYTPFGYLEVSPSGPLRYLWTGHEYDPELALYLAGARIYDPLLGRFYQPDPAQQFASPYLWGANDPWRFVDPSGEFAFLIVLLIGIAIGAALGGMGYWMRHDASLWDDLFSLGFWSAVALGGLEGGLSAGFGWVAPLMIYRAVGVIGWGVNLGVTLVAEMIGGAVANLVSDLVTEAIDGQRPYGGWGGSAALGAAGGAMFGAFGWASRTVYVPTKWLRARPRLAAVLDNVLDVPNAQRSAYRKLYRRANFGDASKDFHVREDVYRISSLENPSATITKGPGGVMMPEPLDPGGFGSIPWARRDKLANGTVRNQWWPMGHRPGVEHQAHKMYAYWGRRAWLGRLAGDFDSAKRDAATFAAETRDPAKYVAQFTASNGSHDLELTVPGLPFGIYLGP